MVKILKYIAIAILLIVLSPFVILGGYTALVCVPKIPDINRTIGTIGIENRNPPEAVKNLIRTSLRTGNKPSSYVANELMNEYQKDDRGFVKNRHFQWLGWFLLVEFFFDENEVYALFCNTVYNGNGRGLNELSLRLIGRSLNELTLSEAAEVVAYTRNPISFARSRERLEQVRDMLLERLQENSYNNSLHSAH